MSKRKLVAIASVVLLLALVGGASAETPAELQYGGVSGGGDVAAGGGDLPFTGFHVALVALGGAGIAAAGVVLRRMGRDTSR